jgi:hypothetical protein
MRSSVEPLVAPNKPVELTAKTLAFWPQLTASVRRQNSKTESQLTWMSKNI